MTEETVVVPDDQWLIIHTADQSYVWNLGQIADDDLDDALMAARAKVGFPAGDGWAQTPHVTAVLLTWGRPHQTLMDRAVLGLAADLGKVSAKKVAAYRAEHVALQRVDQVASLVTALSGVDGEVLREALAHPDVPSGIEA